MITTHKFSRDWFTSHIIVWRTFLKEFKKEDFEYLELGTYEGKSVIFMLENYPNCKATVIDTFGQTEEYKKLGECGEDYYERFSENIQPYLDRTTIITGHTYDNLIHMLDDEFKTFDIIYVDASHTAKDTLVDMVLAWEMLSINGIMIVDDYNWDRNVGTINHPKDGVDAFLLAYKEKYEIVHKDYQIALRKVTK